MSKFVPVTDELLERARRDGELRRRLVSEHLDQLMIAMGRAKERTKNRSKPDDLTARHMQEGARFAVKLSEILHGIRAKASR